MEGEAGGKPLSPGPRVGAAQEASPLGTWHHPDFCGVGSRGGGPKREAQHWAPLPICLPATIFREKRRDVFFKFLPCRLSVSAGMARSPSQACKWCHTCSALNFHLGNLLVDAPEGTCQFPLEPHRSVPALCSLNPPASLSPFPTCPGAPQVSRALLGGPPTALLRSGCLLHRPPGSGVIPSFGRQSFKTRNQPLLLKAHVSWG